MKLVKACLVDLPQKSASKKNALTLYECEGFLFLGEKECSVGLFMLERGIVLYQFLNCIILIPKEMQ